MSPGHLESAVGHHGPHLRAAITPLVLLETVPESSHNPVSVGPSFTYELQGASYFL